MGASVRRRRGGKRPMPVSIRPSGTFIRRMPAAFCRARTRIGRRCAPALARRADARRIASNLQFVRRRYYNHPVDAPMQIGQRRIRLATGPRIAHHFKDQRRLNHRHGRGIACKDLLHPARLRLDRCRMHDRIQLLHAPAAKGKLCQPRAVQAPIGCEHFRAKVLHNLVEDLLAGLHQRAPQRVSFDHLRAQLAQIAGHGALAAAQTAGESDTQH